MKKIFRIITVTLIPFIIVGFVAIKNKSKITNTVRAFGDLVVDFKTVLPGDALFKITNFAPGDSVTHDVDVKNNGSIGRYAAVKGIKTNTGQVVPYLENRLIIKIYKGADLKYQNSLNHFFTDSDGGNPTVNGTLLDPINPGQTINYDFQVTFPPGSNDNDYQGKSVIFDITFGYVTGDNVVINEVYYKIDADHGLDSVKDTRDTKGNKKGINDEWVELYNPTSHDISLKNWTFVDNSGTSTKINANKIIKAGGFALVSKDADPWRFWDENKDAVKIELGSQIGDGLDNTADHITLKDVSGNSVDFVAWGGDTGWNLYPPPGSSIERLVPGFDTDQPTDWQDKQIPSPGN